jgi:hypothetical protein
VSRVTNSPGSGVIRVESAAEDCLDVRITSETEHGEWLAALQAWEGKLYLNGALDKRADVRRVWKHRYFLLCGPDLHWAAREGQKWLGRVRCRFRFWCFLVKRVRGLCCQMTVAHGRVRKLPLDETNGEPYVIEVAATSGKIIKVKVRC